MSQVTLQQISSFHSTFISVAIKSYDSAYFCFAKVGKFLKAQNASREIKKKNSLHLGMHVSKALLQCHIKQVRQNTKVVYSAIRPH